jgi:putative thiamine transport system ATP-binding protein
MTTGTAQSLHLRAVCIALPGRALIHQLSIDVAPGQIVTVMGASGSGKSSLLAYIGGFMHAPFVATGEVRVGAQRLNDAPPHARRTGILFQDDLLFPHLSVAGNLLFGVPAALRSRAARRDVVDQALSQAGLAGYGERDPATLSGGQRARVALLRTLLSAPQLLLLDEPFGKLDAVLRADFRRFVFEHAQRLRLPTLMVTHDAADAQAAGGAVVVLG